MDQLDFIATSDNLQCLAKYQVFHQFEVVFLKSVVGDFLSLSVHRDVGSQLKRLLKLDSLVDFLQAKTKRQVLLEIPVVDHVILFAMYILDKLGMCSTFYV